MKALPAILAALIAGLIVFFVQEKKIKNLEEQITSKKVSDSQRKQPSSSSSTNSDSIASNAISKSTRTPPTDTPEETLEEMSKEKESPVRSMSKIFESDAGKALLKQQIAMGIPMFYGDFIKDLNLTPEESDYFNELLTERAMIHQQMGMKWMEAAPEDREEIGKEIEQLMGENSNEIDEFFQSEEDSAAFKTYESQLPERQQMGGIRNALSSEPLAPETEDRLVETMYHARLNSGEGTGSDDENWASLAETGDFSTIEDRWEKTDAEIARNIPEILTPDQSETFLAHWEQTRAVQRMHYEMGMRMLNIEPTE